MLDVINKASFVMEENDEMPKTKKSVSYFSNICPVFFAPFDSSYGFSTNAE